MKTEEKKVETSATLKVHKTKGKRSLEYKFNQEELVKLGRELSHALSHLKNLDDHHKAVAKDWKSRIEKQAAEVDGLSNKVACGFEYREIDCELIMNEPPGKKTIIRLDTKEQVRIEDMTEDEMQLNIKFGDDVEGTEALQEDEK